MCCKLRSSCRPTTISKTFVHLNWNFFSLVVAVCSSCLLCFPSSLSSFLFLFRFFLFLLFLISFILEIFYCRYEDVLLRSWDPFKSRIYFISLNWVSLTFYDSDKKCVEVLLVIHRRFNTSLRFRTNTDGINSFPSFPWRHRTYDNDQLYT